MIIFLIHIHISYSEHNSKDRFTHSLQVTGDKAATLDVCTASTTPGSVTYVDLLNAEPSDAANARDLQVGP